MDQKEREQRLVNAIARKYTSAGIQIPIEELIEAGMKGLEEARRKGVDLTADFRFSPLPSWYVRQAITRCIVDHH